MDKNQYKELLAEYMRRESKLKIKVEELELKLEQKEQDYYFDLRNKHLKVVNLEQENTHYTPFEDTELLFLFLDLLS